MMEDLRKAIAFAVGGDDLIHTLNKYGPHLTIDLLVRLIKEEYRKGNVQNQMILEELLASIPNLCAVSEFMYGKPIIKIS